MWSRALDLLPIVTCNFCETRFQKQVRTDFISEVKQVGRIRLNGNKMSNVLRMPLITTWAQHLWSAEIQVLSNMYIKDCFLQKHEGHKQQRTARRIDKHQVFESQIHFGILRKAQDTRLRCMWCMPCSNGIQTRCAWFEFAWMIWWCHLTVMQVRGSRCAVWVAASEGGRQGFGSTHLVWRKHTQATDRPCWPC